MSMNGSTLSEEKRYTVAEVAKHLRRSTSWVSREFRNCPGVIRSGQRRPGKLLYVTLVIPEPVLQRWIRERTVPPENRPFLSIPMAP
jgi:hypothetical protein